MKVQKILAIIRRHGQIWELANTIYKVYMKHCVGLTLIEPWRVHTEYFDSIEEVNDEVIILRLATISEAASSRLLTFPVSMMDMEYGALEEAMIIYLEPQVQERLERLRKANEEQDAYRRDRDRAEYNRLHAIFGNQENS